MIHYLADVATLGRRVEYWEKWLEQTKDEEFEKSVQDWVNKWERLKELRERRRLHSAEAEQALSFYAPVVNIASGFSESEDGALVTRNLLHCAGLDMLIYNP
jgi:hypothetical protein